MFAQPGVPRTPQEKIDDAAQVHRFTGVAPERRPAHPVGPGRRLRRAGRATPTTAASGSARSTPTCSRTTTTSSAASPTPTRGSARKAVAHLLECVDIMDATGSARPEAVVRRRHQLPRPGRHPRRQDRLAEALAGSTRGSAGDQRMLLEYKLFEPAFYTTDVPDWGTACCTAWPSAPRAKVVRGHRAPRARHQHRVHRGLPAARRAARRLRLQLPLLRRRRPDGRRRRPVPAVPHPARGREGGRARRPARGSRSCSTSATTSSRRSPPRSARC